MIEILNFGLKLYCSAISNQINSSLTKVLVLPILSTILYLTTISTTGAKAVGEVKEHSSPLPAVEIFSGDRISYNGRTFPGAWLQRHGTTQLSDVVLRQLFGVDFLNTNNPLKQPIRWFSSVTKPEVLTSLLLGGYRYLDITDLARKAGWQIIARGNTLVISTPIAKLIDIHQDKQTSNKRIIVDLDRPTSWQITQVLSDTQPSDSPSSSPLNQEWTIALDGIMATPTLKEGEGGKTFQTLSGSPIQQVEVVNNQTIIHLHVPVGWSPQVSSLPNPNRLIIDIQPDAVVSRDITWAPGLRWRQQYVNLGQERFPIVWLEVNPRDFGIKLKPIWANPNTLVGTAPLIQTAKRYSAVAAINSGFFNRNNQLPLGAIRRDGQWLSSPILNRGAIAWNDAGQFYIGRLRLQETLIGTNQSISNTAKTPPLATPSRVENNESREQVQLPVVALNSGYIQNGIARYTSVWGATYTPLSDNETIIVVQNNQVINQLPGAKVGPTSVLIPQNGYLLTLRGNAVSSASKLPIGSLVNITSVTTPLDFNSYPNIVGAGPLLVQNRQIVLDAKAEQFSHAFISQKAIRSAICTTATGNLLIAAVHNRVSGAGPTLAEHAQLMQRLGCVNALNLDGGSSTSLYLGGELLDRSPSTAARVHNGIGIFLPVTEVNRQ